MDRQKFDIKNFENTIDKSNLPSWRSIFLRQVEDVEGGLVVR